MEVFSYEVPLGSIGNIKTGDTIEQGVIKEINFVGLSENTVIITGLCESSKKAVKRVYGKSVNSGEESGWIERQVERNKEQEELTKEVFNNSFTNIPELIGRYEINHAEEAKRRNDAMIEKIRFQDEHTKDLVRQVLIEEGLIKPSN